MFRTAFLPFFTIMAALLLTGCVTSGRPSPTTVILQDTGPDEEIDVSGIPDAIPRRELIKTAGNTTPYTVLGKTYEINLDIKGFSETGYASWYGKKFHGRKTSNGEIYDMYAMTAAHKTLPIPTYVRVTNLSNDRAVVVRVNDRGPFHGDRIIDLSYSAAKKLGFHHLGTAKVRVDIVEDFSPAGTPVVKSDGADDAGRAALTYLQAGAFGQEKGALALKQRLSTITNHQIHVRSNPKKKLFQVLIGPFKDDIDLLLVRKQFLEANLSPPHVVEL